MRMELPKDDFILLSFVNTKLRDGYENLNAFCDDLGCSPQDICRRLQNIGYEYDEKSNKFI